MRPVQSLHLARRAVLGMAAGAVMRPRASRAKGKVIRIGVQNGRGTGGRALPPNRQFFLASRDFAHTHPDVLQMLDAQIDATDRWAEQHQADASKLLAASLGLTQPVIARAVSHMGYGVRSLTPDVVADQQRIADTFFDLRLIPQKLDFASAVWSARV